MIGRVNDARAPQASDTRWRFDYFSDHHIHKAAQPEISGIGRLVLFVAAIRAQVHFQDVCEPRMMLKACLVAEFRHRHGSIG